MRERRNVKFKLDIYDDTKTKIIDQRPERDFIHYFFARSIILAGKSDCEGELYMAKDIPYTIETLAIEFNRDTALVKLALDVLIELKMIEVTEDNIYKVKSFAKHQNIKVKVEAKEKSKEGTNVSENNKGTDRKFRSDIVTSNNQVEIKEDRLLEDNLKDKIQEEIYNRKNQDESIGITLEHESNEITCKNIKNADIAPSSIEQGRIDAAGQDIEITSVNTECEEDISVNSESRSPDNCLSNSSSQQNIEANSEQSNLVNLEMKENKKSKKKKNESSLITELAADEIEEEQPLFSFTDGDMPPLREGERLVWGMSSV